MTDHPSQQRAILHRNSFPRSPTTCPAEHGKQRQPSRLPVRPGDAALVTAATMAGLHP